LRAERLIRQAAADGAQIVATPESFLDGYAVRNAELGEERLRALAEPIPKGRYFKRLQRLADELDIHLVAAITELDGEKVFNSAVLLAPDGALLGTYRKKYIWPGEAHLYSPGEEMRVFETPYGHVGIMICFDRMRPAAIRELADHGADLVFNPSGGSWGPESDAIMSQRSRDGGIPIVFVHPVKFLVTAPDGSVLTSRLHGAELDDPTQEDMGTVAYFDLPLDR
jgi:predicted amidohydrolase